MPLTIILSPSYLCMSSACSISQYVLLHSLHSRGMSDEAVYFIIFYEFCECVNMLVQQRTVIYSASETVDHYA